MGIKQKLFASTLVPFAVLGYFQAEATTQTSETNPEVTNACPLTTAAATVEEAEEQVYFVGCGGFF